MRLRCSFTVKNEGLNKIIKRVKNLDNNKKLWLEILNNPDELWNFGQGTKYDIFLFLAAVGLLRLGFDEEKTLKILENLLEVDKKSLSPGNSHIH